MPSVQQLLASYFAFDVLLAVQSSRLLTLPSHPPFSSYSSGLSGPSFTGLDGSGSIRSMAGPALSMAALAVVIIVPASRLCLLECSFAASRAFSLMEDLLPQKLPPPSCNNLSSLSEATTDIAPSSFALDLVMAAVESVPPLAGPCSLLRQSAPRPLRTALAPK